MTHIVDFVDYIDLVQYSSLDRRTKPLGSRSQHSAQVNKDVCNSPNHKDLVDFDPSGDMMHGL